MAIQMRKISEKIKTQQKFTIFVVFVTSRIRNRLHARGCSRYQLPIYRFNYIHATTYTLILDKTAYE